MNANTGPLWTEPLHERAASRIRDMIISGALQPGEPISEKELCDEFGISRTPLREALKILAAEGLTELLPRRGAIVTPIVTEQLQQKFEVVRLLEDYAVKRLCEHATDEQIAQLQAVHEQLLAAAAAGNETEFMACNDRFHEGIMTASGNQSLVDAHAPLWQHLRRARQSVMKTPDVSRSKVQAHERLMKAIRKRDAAQAERELEVRWELAASVLESLAKSAPSARSAKPKAVK